MQQLVNSSEQIPTSTIPFSLPLFHPLTLLLGSLPSITPPPLFLTPYSVHVLRQGAVTAHQVTFHACLVKNWQRTKEEMTLHSCLVNILVIMSLTGLLGLHASPKLIISFLLLSSLCLSSTPSLGSSPSKLELHEAHVPRANINVK